MDGTTARQPDRHRLPARGPRVLFREKDNPERRYDYLDDVIGTIGKGMLGLTVNCARCHNHKFDPIAQKDYYALQASLFGYVETERAAGAAGRGRGVPGEERGDRRQARRARSAKIAAIEKPYRDTLELEQIKSEFSDAHLSGAPSKPEARADAGREAARDPGASRRSASPRPRSTRLLTPAELRTEERARRRRSAALEKRAARAAADGRDRHRRRLSLLAARRAATRSISCPKCRIPPPFAGQLPAQGPGTLRGAAVVFPDSRRRREPAARR